MQIINYEYFSYSIYASLNPNLKAKNGDSDIAVVIRNRNSPENPLVQRFTPGGFEKKDIAVFPVVSGLTDTQYNEQNNVSTGKYLLIYLNNFYLIFKL